MFPKLISNGFTYFELSFPILQQSLYYYNLAFLLIEMDKQLAEIIEECERRLNQAMVCYPFHVLVIFSLNNIIVFHTYLLNYLLTFLNLFYQGKTGWESAQRASRSSRAREFHCRLGGDANEI